MKNKTTDIKLRRARQSYFFALSRVLILLSERVRGLWNCGTDGARLNFSQGHANCGDLCCNQSLSKWNCCGKARRLPRMNYIDYKLATNDLGAVKRKMFHPRRMSRITIGRVSGFSQ